MKKATSLLLLSLFLGQTFACTTFFLNKNGQLVFGRNYDWLTDAGMVCTNVRGISKTSSAVKDGDTISWLSKYGSITFNQYGKEYPTGGMNENGLVVELMWADGSRYPDKDNRPALNVLQWVQYQLDNCQTVEEVIATNETLRISQDNPPLHYLVADAKGNVATIEFFEGKAVVHKGQDLPFPVLTNSPYSVSAQTATDAKVSSGNTSFSFQDNSLQRFTTACSMVQQFQSTDVQKPTVDFAFDILQSVSQPDFTKWSIVYDLQNKQIFFKTASATNIKTIAFSSLDLSCSGGSMAADMNMKSIKGDFQKQLKPFTDKINRAIMERSANESRSQINITQSEIDASVAYANGIRCKS